MVAADGNRPTLVFFHSPKSGACRRTEAYLAQVLQRSQNHSTFKLYRVADEVRPDLMERFRVAVLPTLVVIDEKRVRGRLEEPAGCREIEEFLSPWLRRANGRNGATGAATD